MLGSINFGVEELVKATGDQEIPGTGISMDDVAETAKFLQAGIADGRLTY